MSLPYGERERCLKKGYNQWRRHRWVWDGQAQLDICSNCRALRRADGIILRGKQETILPSYAKHKRERRAW